MSVKYYTWTDDGMHESNSMKDYVRAEDYAALEKLHEDTVAFLGKSYKEHTDRLEAELKAVKAAILNAEREATLDLCAQESALKTGEVES